MLREVYDLANEQREAGTLTLALALTLTLTLTLTLAVALTLTLTLTLTLAVALALALTRHAAARPRATHQRGRLWLLPPARQARG